MATYNSQYTGAQIDAGVERALAIPDGTGNLNKALVHKTSGDEWHKIGTAQMTSDTATNGQVLTATGNGGLEWRAPAGGSATWGAIGGELEDQTDLQGALDDKQDLITSSTNLNVGSLTASNLYVVDPSTLVTNRISKLYIHNIEIQTACAQWRLMFRIVNDVSTSYSSNYNALYTYLKNKYNGEWIYTQGFFVSGSEYHNITYLVASDSSANKYLYAYYVSDTHTLTNGYATASATSVSDTVIAL